MTSGTYAIEVSTRFNATHRVRLADGTLEPMHGHDWQVTVELRARTLDDTHMVADFLDVRRTLNDISRALNHQCLNDHEWFADTTPTAEQVARVLFDRLTSVSAWGGKVCAVRVAEEPGCTAAFLPDHTNRSSKASKVDDYSHGS